MFLFCFFFTFSDFGGALLVLSTLTSHSSILLLIKIFWEKMVGFRPADVPPSAAVKFVGAGTAACIADLFTFPLDTAKVRLQVRTVFFVFISTSNCSVADPHIWDYRFDKHEKKSIRSHTELSHPLFFLLNRSKERPKLQ